MQEPLVIDRPPRIQPELPFEQIDIPPPPEKKDEGYTRLIQVSLPLVTIIGYVLVSMVGGSGRNPLLLIPMALSVVASTAFSIYSYIKEKQSEAEITRAYHDQLIELSKDMQTYHDIQRRFYVYNYPSINGTMTIVDDARHEVEKTDRTLRSNVRLWERRVSDDDFGAIRIGMGTLPSTVQYTLGNVTNFADSHVREAMKLAADSRFVHDIPVIINLRQPPTKDESQNDDDAAQVKENDDQRIPITHALGIAGAQADVYEFIHSILTHFLVFHAPMDATLYLIASQRVGWEWIESVPHAQDHEKGHYWCFVNDTKQDQPIHPLNDDEGNELEQYLEAIRKVLAQRRLRLQEREEDASGDDPRLPFLLFVVDMLQDAYTPQHLMQTIETDPALSILLEQGSYLGAAVMFLVPERSKVPSGCRAVIEIERTAANHPYAQSHGLFFRYAEEGINTFRYVGTADTVSDPQFMYNLATKLHGLTVRQGAGANLTSSVPFLEFMGYRTVSDLTRSAEKLWQDSTKPDYANWLKVKLGKMAGNKPRTLTFSAKRDGVHGMVAGSTGAGKSELLISMITAMATTYDPSVVNFVLVDYKGGGAFKDFEDLPHCVDIITNLAAEGVTRMFTAIRAEMQRRQRLLNQEPSAKNIVEYRKRGYHETRHAFPYLFIIIDEFAEMIADRSEYKAELESITRIGRSLGVSLILAAQRPSGITDQMRSNIKFRICLRVETPGESREMLRRSDAAYLPTGIPGRGYLQVGNEDIELIQAAYSGDVYIDPATISHEKILWLGRGNTNQAIVQDQTPPELYKVIINGLKMLAKDSNVPIQRAPWPGFLPTHLALSERLIVPEEAGFAATPDAHLPNQSTPKAVTFETYLKAGTIETILLGTARDTDITLNPAFNHWINGRSGWIQPLPWKEYALRPVIGLIDNPYEAQQLPLIVDFRRGHAVIFGASGWGKTTFLRSTIISLAASHSPQDLYMYVLDLGGRNLEIIKDLPHVGALILPDEEGYKERVEQLLREIDGMVEMRKNLLSETGEPDIYAYNQANPQKIQPAIVVAIDNFVEFVETFGGDDAEVETMLDKLITLARQSKPYGIHIIITATALSDVPNQIYSLLTERFTLKLVEPTEYRGIVGGQVDDIPDIAGRGYTRVGQQPLSFQVALPLDATSDAATQQHELRSLFAAMQREATAGNYHLPVRVDSLPKSVLFKHLLARHYGLTLDEHFLSALQQKIQHEWQHNLTADHSDWLKAAIGVISGNRPRELVFEAKKDGVHGMIAGGTGSGKSELLMTLIMSLACNYDPSILNFVLVDYKGGGAFTPFKDLPHTVEMVTNLNKTAVQRMFTAINAEMQRRQKLNTDTQTKDIVNYRENGYHLEFNADGNKNPRYRGPYPHLFIIIDEYAEMISDSPDFRDQLESIARLGRAQGVHLLLASQRPTGVSDQMRANIKYRICLRVEGVDTSREMLRRSDAAFLPNGMPGRGYLQVGNDTIELIQVAWAGDDYEYAHNDHGDKLKFFEAIVNLINTLYHQRAKPPTPWPPALNPMVTLDADLSERYADPTYKQLLQLQQHSQRLALNPFLTDWLNHTGTWHSIDWGQIAMRAVVGLVDNPSEARQVPLVVNLTKGHAVLFGAAGWGKTTFLRSLITSLAATHSPNDFHAHVLDLGGRNLEVLNQLPHVGTVIIPDEPGYEEKIQQLWRELELVVKERSSLFSKNFVTNLYEYNQKATQPLPAILVAVDNIAEYLETFGKTSAKDDKSSLVDAFVNLVRQGKAYGIHFVITASRLNALSTKLYSLFTERYTLRISDSGDYPAIVGTQLGDIEEIRGRGYTKIGRHALAFQIALPPGTLQLNSETNQMELIASDATQITAIGSMMKQVVQDRGYYTTPLHIGALPNAHMYRDLLPTLRAQTPAPVSDSFVASLKALMQVRWHHHASDTHADWLQVTLGMIAGNRPKTLYFAADKDGVHGMVAGGTGSGKSEMLMALIIGLVLNYSPAILNFVLVDYKGGGAFKPFDDLPHVIDSVTNLNKAAVERMFTAISAEIRRRQKLNADTSTKDIIDYRKKGYHLEFKADGNENPQYRGSYPHLFIIIDEYSEMFADNPEFLSVLDSITRVGRAQGVNLLLASQKPKGVSDQMQANIKMRLCLRVEDADTSRELLGRPEAAQLPSIPGRGYVKSGNNEIELIQVSYTGDSQPDDREAAVLWQAHPRAPRQATEAPRLYDMVVQLAREITGATPICKPWPRFLPAIFSLQSALLDVQQNHSFITEPAVSDWLNGDTADLWTGIDWLHAAMRARVLLTDDPEAARQVLHPLDLSRNHMALFGDSGLGKTTLLRTLMVALAVTHSPAELHMYVLDLAGRNFRALEALPHVGAALYADDATFEERLGRLLDMVTNLVDQRQQLLSEANVTSVYTYNQQHQSSPLPIVLVVIDNIAVLTENYANTVELVLIPLLRRSLSMGVSFVVTGNTPSAMPSRLFNAFRERLTFKQSDPDKYMDIVGRGARGIEDLPGRGYIRTETTPLLFQAALPVGLFNSAGDDQRSEAQEVERLAEIMKTYQRQHPPLRDSHPNRIAILPEVVNLHDVLNHATAPTKTSVVGVLGQTSSLKPAMIDLRKLGPHFAVFGPPVSGKTTTLHSWILGLAQRYSPERVRFVLIDTQANGKLYLYGGEHSLAELPHVIHTIADAEQLPTLLNLLDHECKALARNPATARLFVVIDNFDDFNEEMERAKLAPQFAALVRRHGGDGFHVLIAATPDGGNSDIRRRILAANYGIGLRVAASLDALRVVRTPASMRDKELPIGRGFIVKAGQATMIQIATPYTIQGAITPLDDPEMAETQARAALDTWVIRLQQRYVGQQAHWSQVSAEPSSASAQSRDPNLLRMLDYVQRGFQREVERLHQRASPRTDNDTNHNSLPNLNGYIEEIKQQRDAIKNVLASLPSKLNSLKSSERELPADQLITLQNKYTEVLEHIRTSLKEQQDKEKNQSNPTDLLSQLMLDNGHQPQAATDLTLIQQVAELNDEQRNDPAALVPVLVEILAREKSLATDSGLSLQEQRALAQSFDTASLLDELARIFEPAMFTPEA